MRIHTLPGPAKPNRKDRWFADSLQFTQDSQRLFLRFTGESGRDRAIGQLGMVTGQWEQLYDFDTLWHDSPLKPWSPDFSRVVSHVGEGPFQDGDIIVIDEPQNILGHTPPWVMRCVETSLDTANVTGIVFSPDGRWLYGAELSRTGPNRKIVSTSIARADVQALFAKPVTETAGFNRLTGQPGTSRDVEPTKWKQFVTLPAGVAVQVIAVSPDARLLAVGTHTGDTHLIRVRGGQTLGIFNRKRGKRTENHAVRRISFRPSGKQLGVVVDGMVRVWDVKSAKLLWDAEDAKAHVMDLAYHPDGNTLAVARSDGAAVFLDAQTGAVRKRYAWKVGQLHSVAFSPDGLTCAAGGEKGQVVVWDVDA